MPGRGRPRTPLRRPAGTEPISPGVARRRWEAKRHRPATLKIGRRRKDWSASAKELAMRQYRAEGTATIKRDFRPILVKDFGDTKRTLVLKRFGEDRERFLEAQKILMERKWDSFTVHQIKDAYISKHPPGLRSSDEMVWIQRYFHRPTLESLIRFLDGEKVPPEEARLCNELTRQNIGINEDLAAYAKRELEPVASSYPFVPSQKYDFPYSNIIVFGMHKDGRDKGRLKIGLLDI